MEPNGNRVTISCPNCKTVAEPLDQVDALAVCRKCGETVLIDAVGKTHKAMGINVDSLNKEGLARLRKARLAAGRPE